MILERASHAFRLRVPIGRRPKSYRKTQDRFCSICAGWIQEDVRAAEIEGAPREEGFLKGTAAFQEGGLVGLRQLEGAGADELERGCGDEFGGESALWV